MKYLLDTNACISILRYPAASKVAQKIKSILPGELATSVMVRCELIYGALRSRDPVGNSAKVDRVLASITMLQVDERVVDEAAKIRADLGARGMAIGPYDTLIAATAVAHRLIVVTRNTREFSRIAGLTIEDWEA